MESVWSGTTEDAFFDGTHFDRCRKLLTAEYEYSGRSNASSYYVISCDVGRRDCPSEVCVFKVVPQAQGPALKSLVNLYSMSDMHFEDQCIFLKKLYYKYKARCLVIDGNGLGIGLVDYLVKSQVDEEGNPLPDFGVANDVANEYKKFRTQDTELDAVYIIKANAPINTECYTYAQTQLDAGKLRLLIDRKTANLRLLQTQKGQKMKPEQRKEYLYPFEMTDILKDQLMNLKQENEGVNIILKQVNRSIKKDKVSAFIYGLYWIKQEEGRKKKRKRFNASDWSFFN